MKFSLNDQGQQEATFAGKLVSISDKVLTNTNGKNYKVATIEFEKPDHSQGRCSAFVFEGNYKHGMEIGNTYLSTATQTDKSVLVRVSHLIAGGARPDADMFGFEGVAAEVNATADAEVETTQANF